MDDYRKLGAGEWGSKARKWESRQHKSRGRQAVREEVRAQSGPSLLALERIDRALGHISNARAELDRACQELCSLRHAAPLYRATGNTSDKVIALYRRVRELETSTKPITVDSEPEGK